MVVATCASALPSAFEYRRRLPVIDWRPVPPRASASVPVVSESAMPSDEVAITVGTAAPPVAFAQSELAAMEAKEMLEFVPPIWKPSVPEEARPVPTASVEVAAVVSTVPSAFVYVTRLPVSDEAPVPPFVTATMPVTFDAVPPMFSVEVAT